MSYGTYSRPIDDRLEQWFRSIHLPLTVALLLVSGLCLAGLTHLDFDDNLQNLFSGDSPEFREFQELNERFRTAEDQCVVMLTADKILHPDPMRSLRIIDRQLHQLKTITDINSICHLLRPKRLGRMFFPIMPFEDAEEKEWWAAAEQLATHPLGPGILLSDDGKNTLVTFRFQPELSAKEISKTLASIREILTKHWTGGAGDLHSNRTFGITGLPILQREVTDCLKRDQTKFTILGLLFALIIGWFLFRRLAPVLIVAGVPFLGLGCIMGLLGWARIPLNIVNNVVTPLVLVTGFAETIHILFLTRSVLGSGESPRRATMISLRQLFVPSLLAAITTAIGFGSLALSQDRSLKEFAMVASLASMMMFVVVMVASGCLLATRVSQWCLPRKNDNDREQLIAASDTNTGNSVFALFAKRWVPLTTCCLAILAISLSVWQAARNHSDYRFTENLPESNAAVRTLRRIDRAFGGSSANHLLVRFREKPDPDLLFRVLKLIQDELEENGLVEKSVSLVDLLDSLPPVGGTDLDHFRQLKYLPRDTWTPFLALRPTVANIHLKLPDSGSAELSRLLDRIHDRLGSLGVDESVSISVTGLDVLAVRRSKQMINDLITSLTGASIVIFLLIIFVYRSVPFALAAILVNAFPILGVAGMMSLLDQPIQYTSIMLLCVCMGLAVDDTVHFLSKLKINLSAGLDFESAVELTFDRLWPILVSTSVMLGVGFGLAGTSSIPTFQTFGGFACVALGLALIGDLIILPSVLVLMHRLRAGTRHGTKLSENGARGGYDSD